MAGFFSDATIAAFRGDYSQGIFFRLGTATPLRLAFGANDVPIQIPGLDGAGSVYLGGGRFVSMPQVELMINGRSSSVVFSLSGVDASFQSMLIATNPQVLGALVTIAICPMDDLWQPIVAPTPMWTGTAEFVTAGMKHETDQTKPRLLTVGLSASSGDTSRSFQPLATFTDQAQRRISPTDAFCSRATSYVPGKILTWPLSY